MTTYLDVAAVRIQQYLSRTRRLAGVRGASAMIRRATSRYEYLPVDPCVPGRVPSESVVVDPIERICLQLSAGWYRNPEAGDIDGVVSLRNCDDLSEDAVRQTFGKVVTILRHGVVDETPVPQAPSIPRLPGAELHGKWAVVEKGVDYLSAYSAMQSKVLYAAPVVLDYPGLQPCVICGTAPAAQRIEKHKSLRFPPVCADCVEREDHPGRGRGVYQAFEGDQLHFGVEADLLKALDPKGKPRYVQDFEHLSALAKYATSDTHDRSNHLATITIDGDGIGAHFEAALKDPNFDGSRRAEAVKKLADATRLALEEATRAVHARMSKGFEDMACAVIPHVRGGDDILVSVPANQGWCFARAFLAEFELQTADIVQGRKFTATAAIVFANHEAPFTETAEYADRLLSQTKVTAARLRHQRIDARSMIGWRDLTQDGANLIHDAIDLADWNKVSEQMKRVRDIDANGLTVMRRIIAEVDGGNADPQLVLHRLQADQRRLGRGAIDRFGSFDGSAADLLDKMLRLRDDIDRERWWSRDPV